MGKYTRKAKATADGGGGVRSSAAAPVESGKGCGRASYLQLRSRLLIRRPPGRVARGADARRRRMRRKMVEEAEAGGRVGTEENGEANALELEGRERCTRETTPCSLIKDPDGVRTPGSTTKPAGLTQTNRRRVRCADFRNIPSTHEMDDFFAGAEEEQRKSFIDKYNFDPVNEKPLPGRFEWEKLDP